MALPGFPWPFPVPLSPHAIVADVLSACTRFELDAVVAAMRDVFGPVISASTVSLSDGSWLTHTGSDLVPVGVLVVAPLLFAATIGAVVRQDAKRLARAWLVHLPLAVIGGCAAVPLAGYGMAVSDQLARAIQGVTMPHVGKVFSQMANGVASSAATPLVAFVGLFVLFGAIAIWLEVAVLSAAVSMAVFFMPLALMGLIWPVTAHWAKRAVQLFGSLMLAKPVIVGTLCLGANAVSSARGGPGALVSGAAVLLMAAFAPYSVLKLVPVAEAAAVSHLQGLSRQPFHAAERVAERVMEVVARAGALSQGSPGPLAPPGSANATDSLATQDIMARASRGMDQQQDPLGPAGDPAGAVASSAIDHG